MLLVFVEPELLEFLASLIEGSSLAYNYTKFMAVLIIGNFLTLAYAERLGSLNLWEAEESKSIPNC